MKLPKYVFLFPSAVEFVSKRFDLPVFSTGQLFVLYSLQYLPFNCSQKSIVRHAKRMNYAISPATISVSVNSFIDLGLVAVEDGKYSLSPLGREYLSGIRRYLLNKRL
jgi:hypothetical protein